MNSYIYLKGLSRLILRGGWTTFALFLTVCARPEPKPIPPNEPKDSSNLELVWKTPLASGNSSISSFNPIAYKGITAFAGITSST